MAVVTLMGCAASRKTATGSHEERGDSTVAVVTDSVRKSDVKTDSTVHLTTDESHASGTMSEKGRGEETIIERVTESTDASGNKTTSTDRTIHRKGDYERNATYELQRCEMGAQAALAPPVVEQDAGVRVLCRLVEAFGVHDDLHGEAPLPEAHRRPPEGGAGVAVDQGQLPFVIADQRRDVRFVPQNLQGVPGGDPSAAHVRRGAQAVAVLLLGDIVLVVDKLVHSCSISGFVGVPTGCSAM